MMNMWDERYEIEHYFYGKMPNDFLVSSMGSIPKGKVLCLADGEGRNSVFLARAGFDVSAVDLSEVALKKARKLAEENEVEIHYEQADLANYDLGESKWDGIVSIFCHLPSSIRKPLHRKMVDALKPNGTVVLECYAPSQLALGTGGPQDTDMLVSWSELLEEFEGLHIELGHETQRIIMEGVGHTGPGAVTQMIATKK